VFSTLPTNDAPSTITRMRDMGVPAFLLTATLEAILAQRLVRKVCEDCREESMPTPEELADLNLSMADVSGKQFYRGKGCENCNHSGYRGRVGLFELMVINNELREMIMRNASRDELRQCARGHGMITLRDAGLMKAFEGVTTIEEIIRETIIDG